MRKVSLDLIKKINNYVLIQKVSNDAVLILINHEIKVYPHDIQEHIKKYIKYLLWLDDNQKDTKNAWDKYINRVEWLEEQNSKDSLPSQSNKSRMQRIVQDFEEQEKLLKQKRENNKRLESISKELWKDQISDQEDIQMAFEEVILSNGETFIATLIEESLVLDEGTNEELNQTIIFDDELNTILTEDKIEDTKLEDIIQIAENENAVQDNASLDEMLLNNLMKESEELIEDQLEDLSKVETQSTDILTLDLLDELEKNDQETSTFGKTFRALPIIDLEEEEEEEEFKQFSSNKSVDEILNEINLRLDNNNSELFRLNEDDVKDEDISTSDYFMFEDVISKDSTIEPEISYNQDLIDGNTIMIEEENQEESNEDFIIVDDYTSKTNLEELRSFEEEFSDIIIDKSQLVEDGFDSSLKTPEPLANNIEKILYNSNEKSFDNQNTTNDKVEFSLQAETESLTEKEIKKASIESEDYAEIELEQNALDTIISDSSSQILVDKEETYLTIRKYDDLPLEEFILNAEEKTLFETTSEDEETVDQSMFEDSTLQTFAENQNSTLGALEFLNQLEDKYSTLLEVDSEDINNTLQDSQEFKTKSTNTMEALDFLNKMDNKYSEILDDDEDLTEFLEEIE
ncbi:hypothetical protein EELLY_v1c02210 [Entomoplasma ellychniae]|uniref:Uncharacterized protein n=1 Tax=Entomoplasma ellychniae TaxID=2114 RepID=A0A8E2QVP3_9MOLU|nr:hypothetical protein [Entomoplasma ellychniae]PPE04541.1 hypothetical protein EELLY_v1c02210 [Entomoplasma ellychniae]